MKELKNGEQPSTSDILSDRLLFGPERILRRLDNCNCLSLADKKVLTDALDTHVRVLENILDNIGIQETDKVLNEFKLKDAKDMKKIIDILPICR